MALATICDRCGNIYRNKLDQKPEYIICKPEVNYLRSVPIEPFDLCDDCQKELKEWLESGMKGDKPE